MESFAILRAQKISQGAETAAHNHNLRASKTKLEANVNYDRSNENELLLGRRDTVKTINEMIEELDLKTAIRKDANRAIELVLSASPEHFYDFKAAGITRKEWDDLVPSNYEGKMNEYWKEVKRVQKFFKKDNFEKWKKDTVEWVQKTHGKNVVNLVLHMDEKTPHMHLIVVPIVNKKLTAKQYFTPTTARKWQDSYAKATGLKRGISSERKHRTSLEKQVQIAIQKSAIYGYKKGYEKGKYKGYEDGNEEAKKLGTKIGKVLHVLKETLGQKTDAEEDAERALKDYEAREKQAAYRYARQLEALRRQQALEIEELTQKASETITAITKVADRAEIKIIEMEKDIDFLLKIGGKSLKQKYQERKQAPLGSPLEGKPPEASQLR